MNKCFLLLWLLIGAFHLNASDLTRWNALHIRYAFSMMNAMTGDFGYLQGLQSKSNTFMTSIDLEYTRFIKTNQAVYLEHLLNYNMEKGGRVDWSKTVVGFKYYPLAGGTSVDYKDKFNAINLSPSMSMYLGAEVGYGRVLKLVVLSSYDDSADSLVFGGVGGLEKSFGSYGLSLKGTGAYVFSFSKFPLSAIAMSFIMGIYYNF